MKFSDLTEEQFKIFADELEKKYNEEGNLFTEDLIRYWFIHFFKDIDEANKEYIPSIEMPYERGNDTQLEINPDKPQLKTNKQNGNRSRADLYYAYASTKEVFEFKFHRRTNYSENCTSTNLGSLINDFNRLAILDNAKKYSIYVFDQDMKKYFENERHQNKFGFVNYDKVEIKPYIIPDNLYGTKGYKELMTNAFSSFYNKEDYIDKNKDNYNFSKFNYKINVLYKATIKDESDEKKKLYMIIYEISERD